MLTPEDFQVPRLGKCEYPSPLGLSTVQGDDLGDYTPDHVRIPLHIEVDSGERSTDEPFHFEVEDIHKLGGTVLGSSRGPQDPAVIVDFLLQEGINLLFCMGGDGTNAGP
jgi:hypothetical protein